VTVGMAVIMPVVMTVIPMVGTVIVAVTVRVRMSLLHFRFRRAARS
jgi:hypothetical protein